MIENYLLEELVTFAKYKTLAATAEQLMVTQPTVTRGMQKLEDELEVKLFDRQPNRISLTKTGELAAKEAAKVIEQNQQFSRIVRNYDFSHRNIAIASIVPGPLILLHNLKDQDDNIKIFDTLLDQNSVVPNLENDDFSLIFTNEEIITDEIESRFIGTEKLSVNLDKFTYLANKNTVTFAEMTGLSFLVIAEIGIWKDIIQTEIPKAKFLYQDQYDAFTEISKYSNFPYFSTNLSHLDQHHGENDDRVQIPISDESAQMDLYAAYKKSQRQMVTPLITDLANYWNE